MKYVKAAYTHGLLEEEASELRTEWEQRSSCKCVEETFHRCRERVIQDLKSGTGILDEQTEACSVWRTVRGEKRKVSELGKSHKHWALQVMVTRLQGSFIQQTRNMFKALSRESCTQQKLNKHGSAGFSSVCTMQLPQCKASVQSQRWKLTGMGRAGTWF